MDWFPLQLSLHVALWATLWSVLIGLALSYLLARVRFPGRSILEALANIPLVLPPTVLGYALLVALGKRSALGHGYELVTGHPLVFTPQGAIVAACVASLPLFVGQARVALALVDPEVVGAARTDGANDWAIFREILLPLAAPGLLAGVSLAFARALGDFGATLMIAGDTPHRTQTMPLAIYDAVQNDEVGTVRIFVAFSIAISVGVCLLATRLSRTHR